MSDFSVGVNSSDSTVAHLSWLLGWGSIKIGLICLLSHDPRNEGKRYYFRYFLPYTTSMFKCLSIKTVSFYTITFIFTTY
jgi:hypothetical protein